jgi:hypothetical protein
VDRTQNVLYIIQRRSEQLDVLFCLLYINQLPVSVDRTQNVLFIIQRRSEQLDVLFLLLYINQLPVSVDHTQMYYVSSNADRSDLTCFFVCYIPINCLYQWILLKMYYYISSNADRKRRLEQLDMLFRLLYINQLPVY